MSIINLNQSTPVNHFAAAFIRNKLQILKSPESETLLVELWGATSDIV